MSRSLRFAVSGEVPEGVPAPATDASRPAHQATRALLIGPSNIGDAILALEVVASLRRRFPEAHLTVVVGERAAPLFADDPRIQTLVHADRFRTAAERLRLAWALWRHQPHIVADLRHTLYPLLLKPLSVWRYVLQPPKTMPHMRRRHWWKLQAQVPSRRFSRGPSPHRGNASEALTRPAQAADQAPDGSAVWAGARDVAQVDGLCRRWQLDGERPLVLVCPGSRSHIKRWTAEGFARVTDRLQAELRAQVVFCGEPDEEPVVEAIRDLMTQRAHTAVGLTTIRQLGVLMRRAQLVITNDSASLHLASAVDAPTVAIFGPTDAQKYGPTSSECRTVRRQLFCSPCEQPLCRFNHECMRFIGADEVFEAARQLLLRRVRC